MLHNNTNENRRVIVRVWQSSTSLILQKTGSLVSFGHVSLQTFIGGKDNQGHYISFWRADHDNRCCGNKQDHFHTREQDVHYCGQALIGNTYTFYKIDPDKINSYFEWIKDRLHYDIGGYISSYDHEYSANCSSLVFKLMSNAGLNSAHSDFDAYHLQLLRFVEKSGWVPEFLMPTLLAAGETFLRTRYVMSIKPEDFPPIMQEAINTERLLQSSTYINWRNNLFHSRGYLTPEEATMRSLEQAILDKKHTF